MAIDFDKVRKAAAEKDRVIQAAGMEAKTAYKPMVNGAALRPNVGAAPQNTKWVSTGAGRKNTVGDFNTAMDQLKAERRQAAVTQDDVKAKQIYDQMKALRASFGKQTLGDRLVDMTETAFGRSAGNVVNAAGAGIGAVNELERIFKGDNKRAAQAKMEETRRALETGFLSDGRPVTDAMRPTLEAMLADYQAKYEAAEELDSFEVRHPKLAKVEQSLYDAADAMSKEAAEDEKSAKAGLGAAGQFAVDAGIAGMQLYGDAVAGRMLGVGTLPMGARVFGGAAQEARQAGADTGQQLTYGLSSAIVSMLTEKITNVAGPFKNAFGKGVMDDMLAKVSAKPGGKLILSALSEGGEEMFENAMQPLLQRMSYDPTAAYDREWLAETFYSGAVGAVLGGFGGGVDVVGNLGNKTAGKLKLQMPDISAQQKNSNQIAQNKTASPNKGETVEVIKVLANNIPMLQTKQPVATTSAQVLKSVQGNTMAEKARKLFDGIKGVVTRQGFGEIEINGRSVKDDLSHGVGPAKAATIMTVPQVIQHGEQIDFQQNWKGRAYDGYTFAAPVIMDGETVYVAAVVKKTNKNRFYLHEVIDSKGNIIKMSDEESANQTSPATNGDAGTQSPSPNISVPGNQSNVNVENAAATGLKMPPRTPQAVVMPTLTGRLEPQAEVDNKPKSIVMPTLTGVPDKTPVQSGGYETDGYMDALAQDENEMVDPVTPADRIYDAKLRELQDLEPPPEKERAAAVSKRDLDELVELYQDIANPVDTARDARMEASEGLVRTKTEPENKSLREKAREAKSYFLRKMVDAGDSVNRVAKITKDRYLYPYYNMARGSASAGINMIQNEQTDITGKRVGKSLNDIFAPIRAKGDDYYTKFQTFMFDLHNIDRMTLVHGENTAKLDAELALREFDRENPDVATMTEARLLQKAKSIDEEEAALAKERIRLLRKLNQADRMGNKPVFGWEITADISKERADRLLREYPEFAEYQKRVREYVKNLMKYRVDSGLMTAEDAAFLEKYYPNYVPTFRVKDKSPSTKDRKTVRVGKTVGLAEGGNQKLVPLHEALGKQTMQVVREGSKNRFGTRLLENFTANSKNANLQKYVLDAQEYESDFSTETFDEPEIELKKDNTFVVNKNGKKYEMTLDPSMFEAIKALYPDTQESNTLVKVIRAGNNLYKSLITGYNPFFAIRNTVRDLQTAGLYSRNLAAFAKNYPLAIQEISKNGEYWKQYKALGGSFASVFDYQTGTVPEADGKVAKLAARMEGLNMAMEQAPRLAEFMSVVKAGDGSMDNLMDAMHAAADVTTNFGRAGSLGKVLNANFVPFLNPGIQGFDKMVRRVAETKESKEWAKLVIRSSMLAVPPLLINALLYADDDDWKDLRDRDKDTNYLFKIRDGIWLKIPKGRELAVLGATASRIGDLATGKAVNMKDFIATVGDQMAPANPLRQNILAAWFDADIFNASNPGKTWYGADIENQRLQTYAPGERYDSSTDVFSKWVGARLNLSPKKINYLLDQYTGVVGDFVLPLLTPQAEQNVFTKPFVIDSVTSNKLSEQFYETGDQLEYAKNGGDPSAAVLYRFWNQQKSACSDIYKQIREIEESDLSDKEKKEQVRAAQVILNGIQKNAVAVLGTYKVSVKKHLKGSSADAIDYAYREANKECFGAEYALKEYNKDTYEKAVQAHQNNVSYDDYYSYYFDTKDYKTSGGKSKTTKKIEYLQKAKLSAATKAEIYFADLASDSDLKKQAELERSAGISAVDYWEYKTATVGKTKKAEKMEAINSLNLTANQKTALYYANGWAESTLSEAPWIRTVVMPKLRVYGETTVKPSQKLYMPKRN